MYTTSSMLETVGSAACLLFLCNSRFIFIFISNKRFLCKPSASSYLFPGNRWVIGTASYDSECKRFIVMSRWEGWIFFFSESTFTSHCKIDRSLKQDANCVRKVQRPVRLRLPLETCAYLRDRLENNS